MCCVVVGRDLALKEDMYMQGFDGKT